jgi:hypothetical protein
MKIEVTRKLEYADRVAIQQADQAIRKDVIRALVELITNCNDSYHRIEDAGIETSGLIIVEVERKVAQPSLIRVIDNAEGMTPDDLDLKVGRYGEATSGFREGRSVRGLWGRGLKDSFFGLGHGSVSSVRDGKFSRCTLKVINGKPTYQREKSLRASRAIKNQFELSFGVGTSMEIVVAREDIRIPQFDTLRRNLERHFELRAVMNNRKRTVLLRDIDGRGKMRNEVQLTHKPPIGKQVLDTTFEIPGFMAAGHLQVFRADEPLSTPAEEGDYADGGILVVSRGVVLSLTLFKFEHNEHASRFYGSINCDYLHELLSSDDSVLTATRDGLNWRHPFARILKSIIEAHLDPLVDEERKRAQTEQGGKTNKKLRQRLCNVLEELNSIAKAELSKLSGFGDGDEPSGKKLPVLPAGGFGFIPPYALIQTGKTVALILRAAIPDKAEVGCLVNIESDNPEIMVLTPQVRIDAREDNKEIGEAKVELEGRQVGAEAIITANLNNLKAEALVKVISKREPPTTPTQKREHGGLFHDFRFDPADDPRQRVRFDRANSDIVIATRAPSVATYLSEHGDGYDTPQGQVLLAELVTEAVCSEIARRGVEGGIFLAVGGAEADAIRREQINLQNKYAHIIHAALVDPEYRRNSRGQKPRNGRPSRTELLTNAVIAV